MLSAFISAGWEQRHAGVRFVAGAFSYHSMGPSENHHPFTNGTSFSLAKLVGGSPRFTRFGTFRFRGEVTLSDTTVRHHSCVCATLVARGRTWAILKSTDDIDAKWTDRLSLNELIRVRLCLWSSHGQDYNRHAVFTWVMLQYPVFIAERAAFTSRIKITSYD